MGLRQALGAGGAPLSRPSSLPCTFRPALSRSSSEARRAWTAGETVSIENWPLPGQGAGAGFAVAIGTFPRSLEVRFAQARLLRARTDSKL